MVLGLSGSVAFAQKNETMKKGDINMAAMMQNSPHHLLMMAYRQNTLNFAKALQDMAKGGTLEDVEAAPPALVYQYKLKEAQGQSDCKMWIGKSDGLPHKILQKSASPMPGSSGGKNDRTVNYYDYNVDIKIEPPI